MNTEASLKSTKFWIAFFAVILILSAAAAVFVSLFSPVNTVAKVYLDGKLIRRIDLSAVTAPYEFEVNGVVRNTVRVENGRICVLEATCRDQICVHRGFVSGGMVPIVCMPNKLVIKIERTSDMTADAVAE